MQTSHTNSYGNVVAIDSQDKGYKEGKDRLSFNSYKAVCEKTFLKEVSMAAMPKRNTHKPTIIYHQLPTTNNQPLATAHCQDL